MSAIIAQGKFVLCTSMVFHLILLDSECVFISSIHSSQSARHWEVP